MDGECCKIANVDGGVLVVVHCRRLREAGVYISEALEGDLVLIPYLSTPASAIGSNP